MTKPSVAIVVFSSSARSLGHQRHPVAELKTKSKWAGQTCGIVNFDLIFSVEAQLHL
jgi:hypothetical protein